MGLLGPKENEERERERGDGSAVEKSTGFQRLDIFGVVVDVSAAEHCFCVVTRHIINTAPLEMLAKMVIQVS
ncbi:unnamed protein product [Angiostrongylus costaricensis]|uniref:Uncharacterized protein n=1 Tax=Angiostrongylus costaricensis TaxID=334426 RepID=A0A0R3PDM6_ANGCS|nr:unnamed protein product [Angiostrongylus costaricensis]